MFKHLQRGHVRIIDVVRNEMVIPFIHSLQALEAVLQEHTTCQVRNEGHMMVAFRAQVQQSARVDM